MVEEELPVKTYPSGIVHHKNDNQQNLRVTHEEEKQDEVVPIDKINWDDKAKFDRQNTVTKIVLHCSANREGQDCSVEKINEIHQRERGWSAIGYHYVIYRDGSVHKGRPDYIKGAHAYGANTNSLGICYIGGLTKDGSKAKDTRTPEQKKAMHHLVDSLLQVYPKATVHGHYEYAKKDCPCFDVQSEFP